MSEKIGKLNIMALKSRHYFFIPTLDYQECPTCHIFMEIQAYYYGSYCEGPGVIIFPESPNSIRCPSCLEIVEELPDSPLDSPAIARWELEGDDILNES